MSAWQSHIQRPLEWDDERLAGDAPIAYSPTESVAFSFGYNEAIREAKEHAALLAMRRSDGV